MQLRQGPAQGIPGFQCVGGVQRLQRQQQAALRVDLQVAHCGGSQLAGARQAGLRLRRLGVAVGKLAEPHRGQ